MDDIEQLRQFTVVSMHTYAAAACAKMLEAEGLMEQVLVLRSDATACFDRATALSMEYAEAKAASDKIIPF